MYTNTHRPEASCAAAASSGWPTRAAGVRVVSGIATQRSASNVKYKI